MTPEQFISTWAHSDLNERQGAQLMDHGFGLEINVDKTCSGGYADAWSARLEGAPT